MDVRVLAIEDEKPFVHLLKALLRGHSVDSAGTLHAGKQALLLRSYDVALVDLQLPDSSEERTKQELVQLNRLSPKTRFVVVTGHVPQEELPGCTVVSKADGDFVHRLLGAMGLA